MSGKDDSLLSSLTELRRREAWSQTGLADKLGISQGHLSRIERGISKLSHKIRQNAVRLLSSVESNRGAVSDLETEILMAMRTSNEFKELMSLCIKMHDRGKTR